MKGRAAESLVVACALVGLAGCPRLPPPPPRPAVALVRLDRAPAAEAPAGTAFRARFEVHNRGAASLVLAAVDWEIAIGERALLRGRVHEHRPFAPDEDAAIDVAIAVPAPLEPELRRGVRIRLRGMIHFESPAGGAGAPAPFDEDATLP